MARKAGADIPEKVEESRTLFIDGRQAFNARGQKIATLESLQHGFEIAAMRGFSEVVDVRSKARYVEAKGKLQEGGGAGVQVFFKAHLTPAGKPDTYSMRGEIQLISYNDSISSEDERNDEIDLGTIKVKLHPEVVKELRQKMRSEQQLTTKKFSQTIRITHAESHGFVVSGGWIRKPLPDSVSTPGGSTSSAFLSVEVTYGHDMIVQEESNLWTWYPSEDVKGLYAVLDSFDDEEELTESVQDTKVEESRTLFMVQSKARYVEAHADVPALQKRTADAVQKFGDLAATAEKHLADATSQPTYVSELETVYQATSEQFLKGVTLMEQASKGLYRFLYSPDDVSEIMSSLTESAQDTLKKDVVAYFTAKMPEEVQQAWANASANLMHGPSAGEGTFQSNTAIVKEWADANIFDVYYDEQTGEVMTDEPQGFEDGDEWVEPGEYWQIDGYDAKRWVFGELARYV